MPIYRRLPKKGFSNVDFAIRYAIINVGDLSEAFEDGIEINEIVLREAGLVKGRWDGVKILGNGELTKKFTVNVNKVSESAREKIEKAGGSVASPESK